MFIWTVRTILVFGQISPWYGKTLPKKEFLVKVTFWDYRENELIHRRYILKSPPMLGSTPQGILFLINRHFWNFRTCPFWRNCTFAHIWSLRRLSGGFLSRFSLSLVREGYVDGTWMVRGCYVNGTWMVHEWYGAGTRMVHGFDSKTEKKVPRGSF